MFTFGLHQRIKTWDIPDLFSFFYTVYILQLIVNSIANDWNWTTDLWFRNQPLYQLRHRLLGNFQKERLIQTSLVIYPSEPSSAWLASSTPKIWVRIPLNSIVCLYKCYLVKTKIGKKSCGLDDFYPKRQKRKRPGSAEFEASFLPLLLFLF